MDKTTRFRLEALAATLAGGAVRLLPRSVMLGLGQGLGRFWGILDRRHLEIALDNLRHAFPDWPEERLQRSALAVYAHFGRVLFDILWLRGRPKERVLPLMAEVVGREHVEKAMAAGRGILYATAHIGNWEMQGLAHAWTFAPFSVVARPLDNPELDRRLNAVRVQAGNTVIYKQRALGNVLKTLRGGGAVAILVDQNVQEQDGIFVDFFGRPAATTTVVAAVAIKTGCVLGAGYTQMRSDGRYRLIYEPPIEWTPSGDRQRDVAELTQRVTKVIEGWVREVPEQWLWMHRRWKTRPPGETA